MLSQHEVSIEAVDTGWQQRVEAGAPVVVAARCHCSAGCDLSGCSVFVTLGSLTPVQHTLTGFDAKKRSTDINYILATAPDAVGDMPSSIRFPASTINGAVHDETVSTFMIFTVPVRTSLTVWDVPRPVVTGSRFRMQAGLKSTRGLSMAGAKLSVTDANGSTIAHAPVESQPMKNTDALYRSTLSLVAPANKGTHTWKVLADVTALAYPHRGSSIELVILAVDPPRYSLRISLADENGSAVPGTLLRVGPYQQTTGADGTASFFVAGGSYDLQSWHPDHELLSQEITVSSDTAVFFTIRSIPRADNEFL